MPPIAPSVAPKAKESKPATASAGGRLFKKSFSRNAEGNGNLGRKAERAVSQKKQDHPSSSPPPSASKESATAGLAAGATALVGALLPKGEAAQARDVPEEAKKTPIKDENDKALVKARLWRLTDYRRDTLSVELDDLKRDMRGGKNKAAFVAQNLNGKLNFSDNEAPLAFATQLPLVGGAIGLFKYLPLVGGVFGDRRDDDSYAYRAQLSYAKFGDQVQGIKAERGKYDGFFRRGVEKHNQKEALQNHDRFWAARKELADQVKQEIFKPYGNKLSAQDRLLIQRNIYHASLDGYDEAIRERDRAFKPVTSKDREAIEQAAIAKAVAKGKSLAKDFAANPLKVDLKDWNAVKAIDANSKAYQIRVAAWADQARSLGYGNVAQAVAADASNYALEQDKNRLDGFLQQAKVDPKEVYKLLPNDVAYRRGGLLGSELPFDKLMFLPAVPMMARIPMMFGIPIHKKLMNFTQWWEHKVAGRAYAGAVNLLARPVQFLKADRLFSNTIGKGWDQAAHIYRNSAPANFFKGVDAAAEIAIRTPAQTPGNGKWLGVLWKNIPKAGPLARAAGIVAVATGLWMMFGGKAFTKESVTGPELDKHKPERFGQDRPHKDRGLMGQYLTVMGTALNITQLLGGADANKFPALRAFGRVTEQTLLKIFPVTYVMNGVALGSHVLKAQVAKLFGKGASAPTPSLPQPSPVVSEVAEDLAREAQRGAAMLRNQSGVLTRTTTAIKEALEPVVASARQIKVSALPGRLKVAGYIIAGLAAGWTAYGYMTSKSTQTVDNKKKPNPVGT